MAYDNLAFSVLENEMNYETIERIKSHVAEAGVNLEEIEQECWDNTLHLKNARIYLTAALAEINTNFPELKVP